MEKSTYRAALCSVFLTKYYSGAEIKNEIGSARNTRGRQAICSQGFREKT